MQRRIREQKPRPRRRRHADAELERSERSIAAGASRRAGELLARLREESESIERILRT